VIIKLFRGSASVEIFANKCSKLSGVNYSMRQNISSLAMLLFDHVYKSGRFSADRIRDSSSNGFHD
jgi:hypothetical protein